MKETLETYLKKLQEAQQALEHGQAFHQQVQNAIGEQYGTGQFLCEKCMVEVFHGNDGNFIVRLQELTNPDE
jgi:hypothetical protein